MAIDEGGSTETDDSKNSKDLIKGTKPPFGPVKSSDLDARKLSHCRDYSGEDLSKTVPNYEPKPVPVQPKRFDIWSLVILFGLLGIAELLGVTIPGPIDDMIYNAIAVTLYGGYLSFKDLISLRKK